MRADDLKLHPEFKLMKQSDIVSFYHMQMPRWLFAHSKYKALSLETKVAYTFLLNRFQLSKMNGWVNNNNEVFVIFTRERLAEEMGISYRKAIACFKELVSVNLIWERRLGRGNANQIYLATVELSQEDANKDDTAPFIRPPENACQENGEENGDASNNDKVLQNQDLPNLHIKNGENGTSVTANLELSDMPKTYPSNTNLSYIDFINTDISQSVSPCDKPTDKFVISKIIQNCELTLLPKDIVGAFKNAIERLYYSEKFRVDGICLPQEKVRSDLALLDGSMVMEAYRKLKRNTDKSIKNSTAYLMSVLYNSIFEVSSDVLVDPDINSFCNQSFGGGSCAFDTNTGVYP